MSRLRWHLDPLFTTWEKLHLLVFIGYASSTISHLDLFGFFAFFLADSLNQCQIGWVVFLYSLWGSSLGSGFMDLDGPKVVSIG